MLILVNVLELGLALEFGRQILRLPLTYYENSIVVNEIVSRLRDIRELNQLLSQVLLQLPVSVFYRDSVSGLNGVLQ